MKALVDTSSVTSTVPAFLEQAKNGGLELYSEFKMAGGGPNTEAFDASCNKMSFLAVVNGEVSVEGAGIVRVSSHVQKSTNSTILLRANVLSALKIQLTFEANCDLAGTV